MRAVCRSYSVNLADENQKLGNGHPPMKNLRATDAFFVLTSLEIAADVHFSNSSLKRYVLGFVSLMRVAMNSRNSTWKDNDCLLMLMGSAFKQTRLCGSKTRVISFLRSFSSPQNSMNSERPLLELANSTYSDTDKECSINRTPQNRQKTANAFITYYQ